MAKLTKIQASARGEDCTAHLEGCLSPNTETTVLAHDTRYVPGSKRKHDLRAAYMCVNCHDIVDGREPSTLEWYELGYEWDRAKAKTHVKLLEKGLIKIVGEEEPVNKTLPRR